MGHIELRFTHFGLSAVPNQIPFATFDVSSFKSVALIETKTETGEAKLTVELAHSSHSRFLHHHSDGKSLEYFFRQIGRHK